jgi:F420-dependent oxidoreductase-like protein
MRISTQLGYAGGFHEAVQEVREFEQAGLDTVWVAEAYGFDAVSFMGYLAAMTERVEIASGILPVFTRTPALLAMTAAGVDALSGGRAMLGLGASGPQVIEGWHGVPYDAPLTRTREVVEICRRIWKRERLEFSGKKYQMPLPKEQGTGLGKALKMITHPVRDDIPITIAALTPKSVEMTAEIADGWLPILFHPTKSRERWGSALAAGAAKRDASRAPLRIFAGGAVAFGEGIEDLRNRARPMMALYVGGMGARGKNFYNELFASYGYEKEAAEIQDLYLSGKKREAEAAIPSSFLDETSLIGPEAFVRDRLLELKEAGVNNLNVNFAGHTLSERVQTLERLREITASL